MSLETDLKGKVVLVTGSSGGIGRATAVEFARNGCLVAITGRSVEGVEETAKLCEGVGCDPSKMIQIIADLENVDDCKRVVEETVAKFGGLDVLVNNAGILIVGSLEDCPLEQYEKQMNVNVRSVYVITKTAIPYLKKTKGNVINVSSLAGTRALPGKVAYCMSKAALDHFTQTVALELAEYGIRVNSVNPGVITTNVHRRSGMDEETYQKYLERSKVMHPIGRVGDPSEVAAAIVFLASDRLAGFITGSILPIDGGRSVGCPR